jgi:hypothetical protein
MFDMTGAGHFRRRGHVAGGTRICRRGACGVARNRGRGALGRLKERRLGGCPYSRLRVHAPILGGGSGFDASSLVPFQRGTRCVSGPLGTGKDPRSFWCSRALLVQGSRGDSFGASASSLFSRPSARLFELAYSAGDHQKPTKFARQRGI